MTETSIITAAEQVEAGQLPGARTPPREPTYIRGLPHDRHGRPIPWFVHVDELGRPDFRAIRANGINLALRRKVCWLCGTLLGREAAFVIGPMCTVNRISAEPPSHRECARYAVDACPFLSTPHMRRRTNGLPEHKQAAGVAIQRNPGVACLWFSRGWRTKSAPGGKLFDIGDPSRVTWRTQGRAATRAEALASLESGLPLLREGCAGIPAALAQLDEQLEVAMSYLPAA